MRSVTARAPGRRWGWAIASLAPAVVGACTGQTLTLGRSAPGRYHFEVPQLVAELRSDARTDNPTLTADLLEIFFTSDRSGNKKK